jgi:regulator of nonsense transcripts 2
MSEASKLAEAQFEELGKRIVKSQSKDQIDQRSEECIKRFSGPQNFAKVIRKRVAKMLFAVPRTQHQLIPFYARFTATINQYFPDVAAELVKMLEAEFHAMQA